MAKSRLWILLSLVLVFAAGAAAGIFAERCWFHRRPPFRSSDRGPAPPSHNFWTREIGLSEDQQARIQEVFKKNDERIRTLRTEFYKQLSEIRTALSMEVNAVLTPEQKAKQDAMIQKYREARKPESERREPNSKTRPQGNPTKERIDEKENPPHRGGDPDDSRHSRPGLFPF